MHDLHVSFPKPCDEVWRGMKPVGRNRVCARCDKVIHDLARHDIDELEQRLRRDRDVCVRAPIGADGTVQLLRGGTMRKMIVVGAAASLLAAGAPALAREERPQGIIAGALQLFGFRARVTATDANGRVFHSKTNAKGHYRIKHVPAGTYTLTFVPDCGDSWTLENVVVGVGEVSVPESREEGGCIIVGVMRIEDSGARADGSPA